MTIYLLGLLLILMASISQVQATAPVNEQRVNIQQYDNLDEAIEDIARRTGKTVEEIRKQIENGRQANQSSESHGQSFSRSSYNNIFMGFGGHYTAYLPPIGPCYGLGKAWAMWETDFGSGTIRFHGNKPLGTWQANWTCVGSGGCLFIADALMFDEEEIWAYEVQANPGNWTNNYSNWCEVWT